MPKYKPGQIITITHENYRFICRVVKDSESFCDNCDMFKILNNYINNKTRIKLCWQNFKLRNQPFDCGPNLGLYLNLKVIKYVAI